MTVDTQAQCRCGLPMVQVGSFLMCGHCDSGTCPLCNTYNGRNCALADNLGKVT